MKKMIDDIVSVMYIITQESRGHRLASITDKTVAVAHDILICDRSCDRLRNYSLPTLLFS